MEKKVFAFVGSRSSKRTTYTFVNNILSEINKIEKIDYEILTLNDLCIKPCIGCHSCFKNGYCNQNDDLFFLKEKILAADLFVIAAPVYMHGMPGEMKNIIDRLATWAHTLRLAGKNILIVSTCDTNGHTTVVDDLHIKMLHMGGSVIGKYVGTKFIPQGLETESKVIMLEKVEKDIPFLVTETLKKWESKIITNRFNESLFDKYRKNQIFLLDTEQSTGETDYWVKSGMINYKNFQDYIDTLTLLKIGEEING
ncbi:MAG: flavodoxin family protein [Lachnotalea sp.]